MRSNKLQLNFFHVFAMNRYPRTLKPAVITTPPVTEIKDFEQVPGNAPHDFVYCKGLEIMI